MNVINCVNIRPRRVRMPIEPDLVCFGDFLMFSCYILAAEQMQKFRAEVINAGLYTKDTMQRYIKYSGLISDYKTFCFSQTIKRRNFENYCLDKLHAALAINEIQLGASSFNLFGYNDTPKRYQAFVSRYNLGLNFTRLAKSVKQRGAEFGVSDKFYSLKIEQAVDELGLSDCFDNVPRATEVIVHNGKAVTEDENMSNGLVIMIKILRSVWGEIVNELNKK